MSGLLEVLLWRACRGELYGAGLFASLTSCAGAGLEMVSATWVDRRSEGDCGSENAIQCTIAAAAATANKLRNSYAGFMKLFAAIEHVTASSTSALRHR